MALLEVRGLTKKFGGLVAVRAVDLAIEESKIAALIGPNGAGKTTLFNVLTGLYRPDEGEIRFQNRSLRGATADRRDRTDDRPTWVFQPGAEFRAIASTRAAMSRTNATQKFPPTHLRR